MNDMNQWEFKEAGKKGCGGKRGGGGNEGRGW